VLGFIATFPLYFLTFFISFLPWSIKVPTALQRWWPQRRQDILGWYLMMQALLVFLVFSCVRTKLPHYTMPAFPCIALWLALQLGQQENSFAWSGRCLKIMYAVILAVTLIGFPIFTRYLLTEDLWTQLRPQITPETKIACFGYTEPSLVWKFRGITTNLVRLEDEKGIPVLARQFLTNPPPLILILPTKDLAQLPDTNGLQFSAHGLDMVKFKNWNLTAIVRTANH
jgi:hypothetical protein